MHTAAAQSPARPAQLTRLCMAPSTCAPRRQDLAHYSGPWPRRTFLAMGSKEYSGTRATPGPQWDELLVGYCKELAHMLSSKRVDSSRLMWQVGCCQGRLPLVSTVPASASCRLVAWQWLYHMEPWLSDPPYALHRQVGEVPGSQGAAGPAKAGCPPFSVYIALHAHPLHRCLQAPFLLV